MFLGLNSKCAFGKIDTMKFQVRMRAESAPDLIEVSSVDIDADDPSDGRVINVFESVTLRASPTRETSNGQHDQSR